MAFQHSFRCFLVLFNCLLVRLSRFETLRRPNFRRKFFFLSNAVSNVQHNSCLCLYVCLILSTSERLSTMALLLNGHFPHSGILNFAAIYRVPFDFLLFNDFEVNRLLAV